MRDGASATKPNRDGLNAIELRLYAVWRLFQKVSPQLARILRKFIRFDANSELVLRAKRRQQLGQTDTKPSKHPFGPGGSQSGHAQQGAVTTNVSCRSHFPA